MKRFLILLIILGLNFANTGISQDEPPPTRTIETLWVSDQLAGLMAMWERKQSRFLITPTKIWSHYSRVHVNEVGSLEFNSDVSTILNHWKNEHGGLIKLGSPTGEFHTVLKYFGDDPEELAHIPKPTTEKYADEGPWFLAYRWLENGRAEFGFPFHDEEDPESKPVDPQKILKTLNNPNAFADLQFPDEDSLIPLPADFSNFETLKKYQTSLKKFDADDPADYKTVAASLDKHEKINAGNKVPDHIKGIGLFVGAHHFSIIFHQAMIDAGYNPYSSAFNFVAKQTEVGASQPDLSEDEIAELKILCNRFDSYRSHFETSLETTIKNPKPPTKLPILSIKSAGGE